MLFFIFLMIAVLSTGCGKDSVTGDENGSGDTYIVSGKILYESGVGIEGVLVNIFGTIGDSVLDNKVNVSVSTDSKGIFFFSNIRNGSYTVTPMKAGFSFIPMQSQIIVTDANLSVPTFVGGPVGNGNDGGYGEYTVSGRIVDTSGNGISGISVGFAGEEIGIHVLTDAQGYFSIENIPNGTYTIAPGKEGFVFSPTFTTIIVRGEDVIVDSFIGSPSFDDSSDSLAGFAGTHVYYPMSKSASWTIKRTDTDFDYGSIDVYEYTLTVNGTKIVNDKEYWLLINDDGEFDSFVRIEHDVVYTFTDFAEVNTSEEYTYKNVFRMNSGITKSLSVQNNATNGEWDPTKDELPILQLNLSPGTTYEIMSYSKSEYGASFTLTWIGNYIGTEDVTVTAGTFINCKKYEIIYDAVAVGGGTSQREITTTVLWLAPDVGTVKSIETKTDGVTKTWIREEELIGFSIP